MEIYATGLIESPQDKRDILASEITPAIKRIPTEMPAPFDLAILNQRMTPHCVGYASAAIKQEKELRERVAKTFDGDWIYAECKKIDGIPDQAGTYFRAGMKVLATKGAKPIDEQATEAPKYRIGGYARVDDLSFEGLKKAIAVHGAILGGMRGDNEGWQNAYVKPPKTPKWGHAIALIGYTKDYIIFQNSWGKEWGDNGIGYLPANYLPFEAWVVLVDRPDIAPDAPVNGITGWVAQKYVRPVLKAGNKVYPYYNLHLRKEPMGEIIKTLKKGTELEIASDEIKVGKKYKWIKVYERNN